jgi:hypothetical protein
MGFSYSSTGRGAGVSAVRRTWRRDRSRFPRAGETLYFTCRVEGFTKSEDKVHLTTAVQAFDPRGVALADVDNNAILEQVSAQDKDWEPKIESQIEIPPLVPAGL